MVKKKETAVNLAKKEAPTHPPFQSMIKEAIEALHDKKGSTKAAIRKYIVTNFTVNEKMATVHLRQALKRCSDSGFLKKNGMGSAGRFLLVKPAKAASVTPKKTKAAEPQKRKVLLGKKKVSIGKKSKTSAQKSPKANKTEAVPKEKSAGTKKTTAAPKDGASTSKKAAPKDSASTSKKAAPKEDASTSKKAASKDDGSSSKKAAPKKANQSGAFFKSSQLVAKHHNLFIMGNNLNKLFKCLATLLAPVIVNIFVREDTFDEWWWVWMLHGVLLYVANVYFCIFGKGEPGEWTKVKPRPNQVAAA
ncbi:hypothetical protein QR680_017069 [Steinernema hermaphroditum]|uniref:H15 domain-containing protein n=1 Tax=Steinernema hermaphroditum TaxID=289476 RepID=A0AA39HD67_9BILA|nr:hypothetical protein QR680_017069 [Steinernema hermaphroditum]